MGRSFQASKAGLEKAENAFKLKGYTQEYLAGSVGCTRQVIINFFARRSIDKRYFQGICNELDLEWGEIALLESEKEQSSKVICMDNSVEVITDPSIVAKKSAVDSQGRATFILTGTIDAINKEKLKAIEAHLRKISGDADLTIIDVEEGSIKINLEGSPEGLKRLKELFNSGKLTEVLGFPVENIQILSVKRPILHRDFTPKSFQDAIYELQALLQAKGFLSNISGKFDLETEEAVKEFQKKNNLYVDGIVGPLTWASLCYPKLSYNAKIVSLELQDAVKEVQNILHKEGIFKKEPDGYFDKQTERAVKRLQKIYGIKDDGIVGTATWAVLLGMQQKKEQRVSKMFNSLPLQSLFLWRQLLMIFCILLGIYYSPLPGSVPQFNTAIATAYGLTCIMPFLLECLPKKQSRQRSLPLLEYAPYVLTGIFWKPILNLIMTLIK